MDEVDHGSINQEVDDMGEISGNEEGSEKSDKKLVDGLNIGLGFENEDIAVESIIARSNKEIELLYTKEEVAFIANMGARIHQKWVSINMGFENIRMYVNKLLHGAPLTYQFNNYSSKQVQERFTRIALCLEDFSSLMATDQFALLRGNLCLTQALNLVRQLNVTAEEQLFGYFGNKDVEMWQMYRHYVTPKVLQVHDVIIDDSPESRKLADWLVTRSKEAFDPILCDKTVFNLVTGILLFSSPGLSLTESSRVVAHQQSYFTMLHRHLDRIRNVGDTSILPKIIASIRGIQDIAKIFCITPGTPR